MTIRTSGAQNDFLVNFRDKQFNCQPGDVSLLPTLIDGSFERQEIDLFIEKIKETNGNFFLIDVGANIGLYSIIASGYATSESRIYAFEPDPRNLNRFEKNIRLNGVRNIVLEPSAVGEAGSVSLHLAKFGGLSRLSKDEIDSNLIVKSVSLDTYFENIGISNESTCVLKVDVEGFEPTVIRNSMSFIRTRKPLIFLEYQSIKDRNSLDDWGDLLDQLLAFYPFAYQVCNLQIQQITFSNKHEVFSNSKLQTFIFSFQEIL